MRRWAVVLLGAVCVVLCGLEYASPSQAPPGQAAPVEQKNSDQNSSSEGRPDTQAVPVTTSEFPLDKFENFSAIQNGGPLPGMDVDRFIYRSGKLMRTQGDAAIPEYYITDLPKQQSHAVASNGCLEMHYPYKGSFPFFVSAPGATYERTPIGEEVVDGHHCHVEDLVIHSPKNPVVLHFRLYQADDLQGFPIKIENRRGNAYPWVIHYKDVRLGAQDPSLFLVPDKCQTMAGFKKLGGGAKPKTSKPAKPH